MQIFARYSNIITWIILALCSLFRWRTFGPVSPIFFIFYIIISPLQHSPLQHLIHFVYYHIRNYSGKMSKLIQKYQVSEEDLLCDFSKVELMVFQVTSWTVIHSASFKSCQDISNEVKRKGLVHKKKNLMLYNFGYLHLIDVFQPKISCSLSFSGM